MPLFPGYGVPVNLCILEAYLLPSTACHLVCFSAAGNVAIIGLFKRRRPCTPRRIVATRSVSSPARETIFLRACADHPSPCSSLEHRAQTSEWIRSRTRFLWDSQIARLSISRRRPAFPTTTAESLLINKSLKILLSVHPLPWRRLCFMVLCFLLLDKPCVWWKWSK